ncbi:MAG: RHS repeat domain-containing protein [Gammaproteobacteria bacterium]
MEYTAEGLLTRFADPKSQASTFEYDALGRLTEDVTAGGGGWTAGRHGVRS